MISPEKIAACPFCGGIGILVPVPAGMQADCADVYVRCEACDAVGPSFLFERGSGQDDPHPMAISAWNTRAPSSELLTLRAERDEARRECSAWERQLLEAQSAGIEEIQRAEAAEAQLARQGEVLKEVHRVLCQTRTTPTHLVANDIEWCIDHLRAAIAGEPATVVPGLSEAEQKAQGARCGCRGVDDYCVCQNVPDAVTRRARSTLSPEDSHG